MHVSYKAEYLNTLKIFVSENIGVLKQFKTELTQIDKAKNR